MNKIKLPKQWPHWCKINRCRKEGYKGSRSRHRGPWVWFYFVRGTRRFRVNMYGKLQIDDKHFDRWANSVGMEIDMPLTEEEFNKGLRFLLDYPVINHVERIFAEYDKSNSKPQLVKIDRKQIRKDNDAIHDCIKRAVQRMKNYSSAEVDNMHGLNETITNPEQYYGK